MANLEIEEIKKEVLRCKKLLNLFDIEVKIEKTQNKICYTRFCNIDKTTITTNAIVWNKNNWKDFKAIKAIVSTQETLNNEKIKWLLLKEIYSESIKNLL